ncbi:MAG: ATP-binding protein [Bacteroidales bacterium]
MAHRIQKGLDLIGLSFPGVKEWDLHPLTLSFRGDIAGFEKEYRDDYFDRNLKPYRFSILLSFLFYDFFALLDLYALPELIKPLWTIRFGMVTPLFIAAIVYSFFPSFRKSMQWVLVGIMYLGGLGIIHMTIFASRDAGNHTYYAGLILIFIFGYSFIRARFMYANLAGWAIIVSYEVTALFIAKTPIQVLINNNFFLLGSIIISMFISYYMEYNDRKAFYLRKLLVNEQDKVKGANAALERRVAERTRQLTQTNRDLMTEIEIRRQREEEKAKLESQLLQLQKMQTIGTLAGGIAHDFNNILTPILGYTDMALDEVDTLSELYDDLKQVNNAALRGKDLVQQILTFSRQVDIERKPLRLDDLVKETMVLIKASLPPRVRVVQELETESGFILANKGQMHQVVMNLCTNAIHAMKDQAEGRLQVRLYREEEEEGPRICLSIGDNGTGMDARTLERIFEPFYTQKEVGSGTGLGLSVVHGIISSYKGTIRVESQPGQGTVFRVSFPAHSGSVAEQEPEEEVKRGSGHILLVDDEEEVTMMVGRMLHSLGYTVDVRGDSGQALEAFRSNPEAFDLLITDQAMPELEGLDLVASCRAIRPDLKAILITAYPEGLSRDRVREVGVTRVIPKPIIFRNFSAGIRDVLTGEGTNEMP